MYKIINIYLISALCYVKSMVQAKIVSYNELFFSLSLYNISVFIVMTKNGLSKCGFSIPHQDLQIKFYKSMCYKNTNEMETNLSHLTHNVFLNDCRAYLCVP